MNDEIFREKVGAESIKYLARTAKERRPGCLGYAEAMVIIYNGKRKNRHSRLSLNALYSREGVQHKREIEDVDDDEDSEELEDDGWEGE